MRLHKIFSNVFVLLTLFLIGIFISILLTGCGRDPRIEKAITSLQEINQVEDRNKDTLFYSMLAEWETNQVNRFDRAKDKDRQIAEAARPKLEDFKDDATGAVDEAEFVKALTQYTTDFTQFIVSQELLYKEKMQLLAQKKQGYIEAYNLTRVNQEMRNKLSAVLLEYQQGKIDPNEVTNNALNSLEEIVKLVKDK